MENIKRNYIDSMINLHGLSIVIPGKNILKYLQLNVSTLLLLYPNLKNNIYIFDDNSTDGTKEWAEAEGLKVITWKYIEPNKDNISVKVNNIYQDVMRQITTKYLWLLDGDLFIRPDRKDLFYKVWEKIIINDDKIFSVKDYTNRFPDAIEYVNHYNLHDYLKNVEIDINGNKHQRLWGGFMAMDLSYFKLIDLYFDDTKDHHYENLLYGYFDSGTFFFSKINERNINYSCVGIDSNLFFHFGGRACYQHDKSNDWAVQGINTVIDDIESDQILYDYLRKINFNYKEV